MTREVSQTPQDRSEKLALWRFHLVADALVPGLSAAERGAIVRSLAADEHMDSGGERRRVSVNTLYRWIHAYHEHGLDGLRDRPRQDRGRARRQPELIEEAVRLRQEHPARSAAHIAEIIRARHGVGVAERTLREHFQRRGLSRAELAREAHNFGRFEAAEPNERWIGDVMVGPWVPCPQTKGSRRARLFLIMDDHSRLVIYGRWFDNETLRAGQEALRTAIVRHGLPSRLHLDNGSAYVGDQLRRTCGLLGIAIVHSRPGRPQGRGKIERLFRTVRERFVLEVEQRGIATLEELNQHFWAWSEEYLNRRVHSETGQTPEQRYARLSPRRPNEELLRQAFAWSLSRRVDKTHAVHVQGNAYEVDPALVGRRVALVFVPEDLSRMEVFYEERSFGLAVPRRIERHVHRQVPPPPTTPAPPTGIDYLSTVLEQHDGRRAREEGPIRYRELGGQEWDGEEEHR
jgi:putative transposase